MLGQVWGAAVLVSHTNVCAARQKRNNLFYDKCGLVSTLFVKICWLMHVSYPTLQHVWEM